MANENEFKVILGADSSELKNALAEATKNSKQFAENINKLGKNNAFTALSTSIESAQRSLGKLNPVTGRATQSLTNLSRIVSDAPFGFISISNNIEPALQSFQLLQKETGSTIGAFKSLGASLLGPSGILLGFSALSSAVVLAIQKYGSLDNAIDAMFGTLDAARVAQEAFSKALNESNEAAGKDISNLKLLVSAARDTTRTTNERLSAVRALRSEFKPYFGDLSNEAILNGNVTTAVESATQAILKKAKAQAIASRLAAVETKQLDTDLKRSELIKELEEAQEQMDKLKGAKGPKEDFFHLTRLRVDQLKNSLIELGKTEVDINVERKQLTDIFNKEDIEIPEIKLPKIKKEEDLIKQRIALFQKLRDEIGLLKSEENQLVDLQIQLVLRDAKKEGLSASQIQRSINKLIEEGHIRQGVEVKIPIILTPKIEFDVAGKVLAAANGIKETIQGISFEGAFNPMIESFRKSAEQAAAEMGDIMNVFKMANGQINQLAFRYVDTLNKFQTHAIGAVQDALRALENIPKIVGHGVENSFASIGEGLGAALASGTNPFAVAAEYFVSTIGSVLQQLGKEVIIASKLVVALKAALNKALTNPYASLAAGIALVAAGTALKNIKFNVPQFATGGIATGPRSGYLAMLHGTEMITPIDRVPAMLEADRPIQLMGNWVIEGEQLRFVLAQTEKRRKRR